MFPPRQSSQGPGTSPSISPSSISTAAANDIPAGTLAGPVPVEFRLGLNMSDERSISHVIEVRFNSGTGTLETDLDRSTRWLAYVQSARDRHEQNFEAFRDARGRVFLRAMRDISKGEHLYVWYADDLARENGIPALTPENIRGDRQYLCTKCTKCYEHPNPLKSHIRFGCPKGSCDSHVVSPLSIQGKAPESIFPLNLEPPRKAGLVKNTLNLPVLSPPRLGLVTPVGPTNLSLGSVSAFKPHRKESLPSSPTRPDSNGSSARDSSVSVNKKLSPKLEPTSLRRERLSTSDGERRNTAPLKEDTPNGVSHPIQIFNHIHPPALPFPVDHSAYKYYYPFYPGFPGNTRFCCAPIPSSACVGMNYMDNPMYYPYTVQRTIQSTDRSRLPGEVSGLPRTVSSAEDGMRIGAQIAAMPFKFPLPSDKAGEPLDLLPRSLYLNKSRKGHLCIYCGKLYSRKYGLKIHLRTHTGYKPLKCKVCLRPFGDPSNLNKHIRLHAEGDTPYRCEHCGKVLVRRRDLERHIKSRHPNEEFKPEEKRTDSLKENVDEIQSDEEEDLPQEEIDGVDENEVEVVS